MSNVTELGGKSPAQKAIAQAQAKAEVQEEVQEEKIGRAVKLLKDKYRQLEAAKVVVANIEREITDAETAIEQGSAV